MRTTPPNQPRRAGSPRSVPARPPAARTPARTSAGTAAPPRLLAGLLAALLALPAAAAPGGDQLWRFYADFAVTVVAPVPDISGNGGNDLLVGSEDDTLYLVEGRGAGKGAPLWSVPFRSTLSAAAALGDVTGDGRPEVAGGDELGFIQAVNGGTGAPIWKYLTFGAVLAVLPIPDVDGDKVPDLVFGSENDTLYWMKGKPAAALGEVLTRFGAPPNRGKGGPPGDVTPPRKAAASVSASLGPKDGPAGVNSLALLRKGQDAWGIAAGVSNDTVYCFPPAGGAPLWKVELPGDAWKVAAFPDQDGDGIEELLVACGADIGYLLKGGNGAVLWSHAVTMGAVSVAAAGDMTGDGKPDALIGDGGGKVHCVPGNAAGAAAAAWIYDFKDTSTIYSLAALGDVDGDGRADCAVGTSNDQVAVLTGKGAKAWSADLGGTVYSVANLGDLDGNGSDDVGAGSAMGFAAAFQGHGGTETRLLRSAGPAAGRAAAFRLGSRSGWRLSVPGRPAAGEWNLGGRHLAQEGIVP